MKRNVPSVTALVVAVAHSPSEASCLRSTRVQSVDDWDVAMRGGTQKNTCLPTP